MGIRIALRHEMRRRGLRPADLAQRFGISRSQFGNILQGRYGSSRPIAAEIRNFLIEGAKTVGSSDAVVRGRKPSVVVGRVLMPRRPAQLTQADIARAIRAAKQAGSVEVEVRVGGASILVRIAPSTGAQTPLEPAEDIVL